MDMRIITENVSRAELQKMADVSFGDLIKAVVDVNRGIMAIGGELHSDEEALLLEKGSAQRDLWGINLYPKKVGDDWVEFDSMINLRPSQGNRSRGVENEETQQQIRTIVAKRTTEL